MCLSQKSKSKIIDRTSWTNFKGISLTLWVSCAIFFIFVTNSLIHQDRIEVKEVRQGGSIIRFCVVADGIEKDQFPVSKFDYENKI